MLPPLIFVLFLIAFSAQTAAALPVRGCEVPTPLDNLPDTASLTKEKVKELFDTFNDLFEKKYESEELKQKAVENFGDNLKVINELNKKYAGDNVTFGVNEYDHLSDDEFQALISRQQADFNTPDGLIPTQAPPGTSPSPVTPAPTVEPSDCGFIQNGTRFNALELAATAKPAPLPASFDWRAKKDIVGAVHSQGDCGSCWAFASVAIIQSAYAIKYKKLVQPSEQQMADCGMGAGPGCNGGTYSQALEYAGKNGLSLESEYVPKKYDQDRAKKQNTCAAAGKPNKIRPAAAWNVYPANAKNIQATLVKYGPVGVGFQVGASIRHYKSGVITNKDCNKAETSIGWHAVVAVGYGVDKKTPFWLLKNSWSTTWGEKGYFRMQRGTDLCHIESAMPFAVKF